MYPYEDVSRHFFSIFIANKAVVGSRKLYGKKGHKGLKTTGTMDRIYKTAVSFLFVSSALCVREDPITVVRTIPRSMDLTHTLYIYIGV